MPEQLWFTEILNRLFAGPVTSLLLALHIKPRYPAAPIPNSFAMEVLVFAFLLTLFLLVRSRLSVDRPGALQHTFEGVEGFIQGQSDEIIGHHSEGYTAFLTALTLFILFCNLIGVIPGFESPTAVAVVPLGCALCAFVYYNTQGFKHAGLGYLKHFAGPVLPLS
ncbi:MAG: F0F1 ATP synthase subunit A, partial [Candidatus Sulfotelmatobacter sp.]